MLSCSRNQVLNCVLADMTITYFSKNLEHLQILKDLQIFRKIFAVLRYLGPFLILDFLPAPVNSISLDCLIASQLRLSYILIMRTLPTQGSHIAAYCEVFISTQLVVSYSKFSQ